MGRTASKFLAKRMRGGEKAMCPEYKPNGIKIPETRYHKTIKWLCIGIQAGVVLYLLSIWKSLPDSVPMHYNAIGEADSYGGKWTVWITPAGMLLMYQFLALVERHPDWWNTAVTITRGNCEKVYGMLKNMIVSVKLIVMLIFGYLSICVGFGEKLGGWFLPVSLILTFGCIIIFSVLLVKVSKD